MEHMFLKILLGVVVFTVSFISLMGILVMFSIAITKDNKRYK